ncbi:lysylphosphatidylglycerol synthase transmembrane domain-containing protein [Paraoerskovia marina]|uniref:lysylphosphatidylglycerol synthase transmembrane domain-containing protein n=1 Tax=Paraoerskovia marina TaxID=545619 RepID=UPI0004926C9A|nr:lysylphosphatidylglycerol synthase transmembrane domain-containing protein [Paraoerskovia marina]
MPTHDYASGAPGSQVVGAANSSAEDETVRIVDTTTHRVRNPRDLLSMIVSAVAVVLVLFMAVYAHGTTSGVTEDVRGFSDLLATLLDIPVAVLELIVTLLAPAAVLVELAVRRLGRQVVESIVAALSGYVLGALLIAGLSAWATPSLLQGLSVGYVVSDTPAIPIYAVSLGAMLTVAGPRTRRRTVAWAWNLLFFTLAILVITNLVSLPGVLVALALGRLVGFAVRYASGVRSERAYDGELATAVRRAGFTPAALVRVHDVTTPAGRLEASTDPMTTVTDDGESQEPVHIGPVVRPDVEHPVTLTEDATLAPDLLPAEQTVDPASSDPAAIALSRIGDHRVYALFTPLGSRRDVVVLDGDRQVVGFLTRLWRMLRLRGVEGRAAISLRAVAERYALLSYAATAAGVRTPRLVGIGEAADSIVLVQQHPAGAVSLRDVSDAQLTDDVLTETWRQLRTAHSAGLAHRALNADGILLGHGTDARPEVWLTGWEQGDVASTELARRMDLTQMIALLALRVGAERAVASAARVLPEDDITAIGPLLQPVALPRSTREDLRRNKDLLKQLRAALVERLPKTDVEPIQLTRFGTRTIVTLTLTIVVATVVITQINIEQISSAVADANPWWAVASFLLGLLTWIGSALAFVAFSPVKLSMLRATAVQAAGSFVALAAPAGVGAAALNLRMITRRGVETPLAVATVAVVQVSQFVVTIALLLVLSVFTGEGGLVQTPSTTVLIAIGGVAVAIIAVLLVPAVRTWLWKKIRPTLQQVWPRLSDILGQPWRLTMGIIGNLTLTMSYVLAFDAALAAFGQDLSLIDAAIIYLVGNAAGAAVPTPGGLGTIELALTAGLTAAGIPPAIAASVTVLFRLATYWARIPFGWVAMRVLQRTGDL